MDSSDRATPTGIAFAPWSTPVENDELSLVSLSFGGASAIIDCAVEGMFLEAPASGPIKAGDLEATFISVEKRSTVVFKFKRPSAFRVLDEHGLVDIWVASSANPRPAPTTFMVKGHKWQQESELSWIQPNIEFSLMIATHWNCLEVVGREPSIEIKPAIVHPYARD